MRAYRTVRTAVFIYDCSRLLFLLTLVTAFYSGPAGFEDAGRSFPWMMYAAPNALFPLMSFFLLIRFEISKAYIPLYISGKILSLLCMFLWMGFSLYRQFPPPPEEAWAFQRLAEAFLDILYRMGWAFFLGAADLGSVLGMTLLGRTTKQGACVSLPPEALPVKTAEEGAG
jgi:hypothetical protein